MNPISFFLLFFLGFVLAGWVFLSRLEAVLQKKPEDSSLLLMQQRLDQLRIQFSQVLDNNTRVIQQELGQVLGHVTERLKENAEILQRTQQSLGERLDNAASVVGGNVHRSLGGLEEADRRIYEVGKDIASLQEIMSAPKLRGGLGEFFLRDLLAQILPLRMPANISCPMRARTISH